MITRKQTLHQFKYRASDVVITHEIYNEGSSYPMSHYEIEATPTVELPMSETGYRSFFTPHCNETVEELIEASSYWRDQCVNEVQPSLF